jgi:transcriptional regulator with XRE-family HTH domain
MTTRKDDNQPRYQRKDTTAKAEGRRVHLTLAERKAEQEAALQAGVSNSKARYFGEKNQLLGHLLRETRQEFGLNQSKVAERLGIQQRMISTYESGHTNLLGYSIGAIERIITAWGLSIRTLFDKGLLDDHPEYAIIAGNLTGAGNTVSIPVYADFGAIATGRPPLRHLLMGMDEVRHLNVRRLALVRIQGIGEGSGPVAYNLIQLAADVGTEAAITGAGWEVVGGLQLLR